MTKTFCDACGVEIVATKRPRFTEASAYLTKRVGKPTISITLELEVRTFYSGGGGFTEAVFCGACIREAINATAPAAPVVSIALPDPDGPYTGPILLGQQFLWERGNPILSRRLVVMSLGAAGAPRIGTRIVHLLGGVDPSEAIVWHDEAQFRQRATPWRGDPTLPVNLPTRER